MVVLPILAFGYSGTNAGLFKEDVDLADLAQLSAESLEPLKDSEFKVILMKINHAGAKVLERKAREDLKASKLTLDAKNLRLKSTEADVKAAKATQNQSQVKAAEEALRTAKKDLEHAKMRIKWKEKEVDVQKTGVEKAKLAVSLAETERDVARVSKLIEQMYLRRKSINFRISKKSWRINKRHTKRD